MVVSNLNDWVHLEESHLDLGPAHTRKNTVERLQTFNVFWNLTLSERDENYYTAYANYTAYTAEYLCF